jgi:hypothetical protein
MRALALLACLTAAAHADTKLPTTPAEVFAAGMRIEESAIVDVQDFTIKGSDYRRALIGRFKSGEFVIGGAVLVWCDTKLCWSTHAWLGPGDVETLGIVDLAGAPAAFPRYAYSKSGRALDAGTKPTWPALLVRTTKRENKTTGSRYGGTVTGEHVQSELSVLSLSRKDQQSPQVLRTMVEDIWPTGAGMTVSFAVGKAGALVATEQARIENKSMCLPPKPVVVHYKLDEHRRFQRGTELSNTGCGH